MANTFIEWTDKIDEAIRNGVVHITFEKADGTVREINCSTNATYIDDEHGPKGTKTYDHSKIVRVFDIDKNDWRTVTKTRLISWTKR